MAYRINKAIYQESKIFQEFKQPRILALMVILFPVGPFLLFSNATGLPLPFATATSAACYLPALLLAHKVGQAFENAGTDRVKKSQAIVSQAFSTALVGLIYVTIVFIFSIAVGAIN